MSELERNLAQLKKYYPGLEESLFPKSSKHENAEDVIVKSSRSGEKTMSFLLEGRSLQVHSAYAPSKEAKSLADISLCYDSVVIVFGGGLMYHVKELVERAYPKCRIVVVEPDCRVLARAMREVDMSAILQSGKVSFAISQQEAGLRETLKEEIQRTNFMQVHILKLYAYIARYPEAHSQLMHTLNWLKLRRRIENTTICNQSRLWARNIIKNIKYIPQSVRHWSFFGLLEGKPGVVVSSGPSLDKNVALLKQLKGKAFIIAAYTSLNTLLEHDITPDVVAAVDARQLLRETSRKRKQALKVPLLYISTVDHRLLKKAKGGKIFAPLLDDKYIREVYAERGYEEGMIFPSGSVAVAATDFAATCGCNPIIFMGQDLAFVERRLHSKGVGDKVKVKEQTMKNAILVDGACGGKVPTNPVMALYLHTLEEFIAYDAKAFNRKYIDATEGGALIKGTQVMTLHEVLEHLDIQRSPYSIKKILKAHFADPANKTFDNETAAEFLRLIQKTHHDIANDRSLRALSESGGAVSEQLAEQVLEMLREKTAYFDLEPVYAENRFVQLYGADYANHRLSKDPREAYLRRRAITAEILLQRLKEFDENTGNIFQEIKTLY